MHISCVCKAIGGIFFENLCFAFSVGFTVRFAQDFAIRLIWGLKLEKIIIAGVFFYIFLSSLLSARKPWKIGVFYKLADW